MIKSYMHKIVSFFATVLYRRKIIGKRVVGTNKTLYYEIAQHLTFLFRKKIDYEKNIQLELKKHIKHDSLIFDIGSNVGQYMLLFSSWANEGKIISVEPDPKNFAFAQFNKTINKLSNVEILNTGIGSEEHSAVLYSDSETGGRRSSFKKNFVGSTFNGVKNTILITKFSSLVKNYGVPNFVKIDVEGFEDRVIRGIGIPDTKTTFFIEVRKETKEEVFEFFNKYGFKSRIFVGSKLQMIVNESEIPDFANIIFSNQ